MKIQRNKTLVIASVLLLTIAVSLVAIPVATAQQTVKTYPFIGAVPNPVGKGQQVLLHVGITMPLLSQEMGWEGLSVTIERPDDTTDTIEDIRTDSTGGTGKVYTPDIAGNYTLQTHFPEQVTTPTKMGGSWATGVYDPGTKFLAGDSEKLTLVVQEEPVEYYPGQPLPAEYWTRPIDAQLREWNTIAGNWLDGNRRNPQFVTGNDDAPETAHILWAKPLTTGGLVGDPLGQHSFEIGDAYEGKFASRLILGGKLYYNLYAGPSSGAVDIYREYACVDLHTGEELWSKVFMNNLTLDRGQLFYWDTYDYHGVYDYLWATANPATRALLGLNASHGTIWCAFDAFTGDWVYTLTNVPSGTITYGPRGEILIYTFNLKGGYMTLWNSSAVIATYQDPTPGSMGFGQWRPYGKTINATRNCTVTRHTPLGIQGYTWNASIPKGLPGGVLGVFPGDKVVGALLNRTHVILWGLSLEPGDEGDELFWETWDAPAEWEAGDLTIEFNVMSSEEGVFVLWTKENRQYYGFSLEDGKKLWGPTESEHYMNYYGWTFFGERPPQIAYGKMFSSGVSGIVYCYDVKTGDLLWTYEANDPYQEILWANNWWLFPLFVTDGKIYYGHLEHSPIDPRPRGAPFICLNATTGDVIFRIDGAFRQNLWGGLAIIGDSIIATMDTYDQRIYAIGKGPSATTVEAPTTAITQGSSVVIRGTVMDVSPGTKEYGLTARFPNGVPAIADENMNDWMLYVYKQFPHPADAVGVPVTLDAVDPNGKWIHIDTVTSDASGSFSYMWTPPNEGLYKIIATCMGTKSYYASYAQTALGVGAAPPPPAYTGIDLAIIAAVIVAIIIGIVNLYALRKRK